jgi:hypothetical protein
VRAALLIAAAVAITFAVTRTLQAPGAAPAGARAKGSSDVDYYASLVQDLEGGANYYAAADRLLRERNYPVTPVTSWRHPIFYLALSKLSVSVAQVLLVVLAVWLIYRVHRLGAGPLPVIVAGVCLLSTALARPLVYFTELWAGLLIGHSAIAYARGRHGEGVAWAVGALALRELAAPYCVVAGLIALRERRSREFLWWVVGGLAIAGWYGVHWMQASRFILPTDVTHNTSYFSVWNLRFALDAFSDGTGITIAFPPFVFGMACALAVAAWWSESMPRYVRVAVLTYLVFFLFVGQTFNAYWGFMITAVFSIWLGHAGEGVAILCGRSPRRRIIPSACP